jgi:hypothetical protein
MAATSGMCEMCEEKPATWQSTCTLPSQHDPTKRRRGVHLFCDACWDQICEEAKSVARPGAIVVFQELPL